MNYTYLQIVHYELLKGFRFPFTSIIVSPSCSFSGLTALGDFMNAFQTFNNILKSQTMFEWSVLISTLTFAIFCSIEFCQMALYGGKNE